MNNSTAKHLFSLKRIAAIEARSKNICSSDADFLVKIAATMLGERLTAITREFETAVDLFSPFDGMSHELENADHVNKAFSLRSPHAGRSDKPSGLSNNVVTAELGEQPFAAASINLATSLFALHRCNDLPGMLVKIRKSLAPDGVFLAVLPGDQTLIELRQSLIEAESELIGAANLRVEPFGEIRQYGSLLQRAGFSLPVVDREVLTIRYSSLKKLVIDLRSMGATSTLADHASFPNRELFNRTEQLLFSNFGEDDGKFRITVEMVFMSGWSPHESQQKPMKPGSADNLLKDFL